MERARGARLRQLYLRVHAVVMHARLEKQGLELGAEARVVAGVGPEALPEQSVYDYITSAWQGKGEQSRSRGEQVGGLRNAQEAYSKRARLR